MVLAAHTRVCCSPYLRSPAHTLVAMWWAAQCAAHAVRNRARIPGPSQAIDAKQVYSQQFRASEVHTWSTYSTVGPAPVGGRPEEWPEEANMRGIIIALVLLASPASARDFGQWENQPPLAPPSVRSDHPPVPGSPVTANYQRASGAHIDAPAVDAPANRSNARAGWQTAPGRRGWPPQGQCRRPPARA